MGALPNEGQRFSKDYRPDNRTTGRTRTAWLSQMLDEAANDDGPGGNTHRQAIGRHLIEVASSWQVVVKGQGENAIPVASAKDSVAAAEVLWKYDMGRPPMGNEEGRLALAEHIRKVARDQAELSLAALGNRINAMSDAEKVSFFEMCSTDPAKYLRAAEAELAARDTRVPALPPKDAASGASHGNPLQEQLGGAPGGSLEPANGAEPPEAGTRADGEEDGE